MMLKLAPYFIMLLVIAGAFFYVKNIGKIECENKIKTVIIESTENREKIEHEIKGYNHDAIVKHLADSGWLRND